MTSYELRVTYDCIIESERTEMNRVPHGAFVIRNS